MKAQHSDGLDHKGPRSPLRRASASVWLIAALAAGFAVAGVGVPFYSARIFDKLQHSSRYERDFALGQIRSVMFRLQATAAQASVDPTPARMKRVRIDLAVVKSRMAEFRTGQLGARLDHAPERLARVALIERAVADMTGELINQPPAHWVSRSKRSSARSSGR